MKPPVAAAAPRGALRKQIARVLMDVANDDRYGTQETPFKAALFAADRILTIPEVAAALSTAGRAVPVGMGEALLDLLVRAQEFVGTETSVEAQGPRYMTLEMRQPESESDRLHREANRAERRDRIILDIRAALATRDEEGTE